MERFSMKEFTPLTFLEKKQKIVDEIELLEIERQPIAAKKKEIDEKLGEYNALLKSEFFPELEYKKIYKQKSILIKEKQELEQALMKLNNQIRLKHRESDRAHFQSKSIPDDKLKTVLTELRDKYLAFSADTTRVASMRSMSSRFVEEITICLKYID